MCSGRREQTRAADCLCARALCSSHKKPTLSVASRHQGDCAAVQSQSVVGVLATDYVGFLAEHGLALSAGVTIYVGASNLVPEFQGKPGWRLPVVFFVGAGVFFVTKWMIGAVGLH